MKYKTLFRLALKMVGVCLFASALIEIPLQIAGCYMLFTSPSIHQITSSGLGPEVYTGLDALRVIVKLALGVYFFFGGRWIVNKAIPSNKTYCHECGYLLKNLTGNRCPECDTPFRPETPTPPAIS